MNQDDMLGVTLSGLEAGFRVHHIATSDLSVCMPDESMEEVLGDPAKKDFDHLPVREKGRIVGVVERHSINVTGQVRNKMRQLDDSILVSAEEPLPKFLPTLKESPYRLVVHGPEIHGIVTISDVAKLPVRLLAFTSVAHLEAVLADVIRASCPEDDEKWLSHLKGHRVNIERRLQERKKKNIHLLSPIEVTYLGERITVVSKLRQLNKLEGDRTSITNFRNSLAHDGDFVKECNGVEGLLDRLDLVRYWIDALKDDGGRRGNTLA
jgi:CBS domain-containing protein